MEVANNKNIGEIIVVYRTIVTTIVGELETLE